MRLEVQQKGPYNVLMEFRANAVDAEMEYEPAHVPKLSTLHKISSECNKKSSEVVGNLYSLACENICIRTIRLRPDVHVSFFTISQLNFFNHFAQEYYTTISIDDTGDVVKNLNPTTKKNLINLFQIILHCEKPGLPVAQLLTDKKDIPAVTEFLFEWQRYISRAPDLAVMDCAAVLHFSICKVFNDFDLKTYYSLCWNLVEGDATAARKITTLLRIDRAHYAQMIVRFLKKARASPEAKELFARALCLLVDCHEYEKILYVFFAILLLTYPKTESELSLACKEYLYNFVSEKFSEFPHPVATIPYGQDWFAGILKSVTENQEFLKITKVKNYFRIAKLPKYLVYLSRRIFLWSDVVTFIVKCPVKEPSSCNSEGFNSKLKNRIMQKEVYDMDVFIKKFIDYLKGETGYRVGNICRSFQIF